MTDVPRLNDPAFIASECADDASLSGRTALWRNRSGPQPVDVALSRIRELAPAAVLEVGCGQGAFARALADLGYDVTGIDQSARMVALTAARGVPAEQADVQYLPFDDDQFDVVAANYMLYHVTDLSAGLKEIVRVLRPGGALVAVTNSTHQLREMWYLVGRDLDAGVEWEFSTENGAELLAPYFEKVERVDVDECFNTTEAAIRDYIRFTRFAHLVDNVPTLPDGLNVTAAGSVFVATT